MTTATRKAAEGTNSITTSTESKAREFPGPDGMTPVLESIPGGISITYRDDEARTSVTIRWKGGRTVTRVSAPKSLKCYEAARLAATIKIAADFAVNLDILSN